MLQAVCHRGHPALHAWAGRVSLPWMRHGGQTGPTSGRGPGPRRPGSWWAGWARGAGGFWAPPGWGSACLSFSLVGSVAACSLSPLALRGLGDQTGPRRSPGGRGALTRGCPRALSVSLWPFCWPCHLLSSSVSGSVHSEAEPPRESTLRCPSRTLSLAPRLSLPRDCRLQGVCGSPMSPVPGRSGRSVHAAELAREDERRGRPGGGCSRKGPLSPVSRRDEAAGGSALRLRPADLGTEAPSR